MPHINKQMGSFFLTTKCNLRCVYCYNSNERTVIEEQSLPLHIAKAGVDYYFSTNDSRHIRFYGPGEPTQEFELMKSIVEYAKTKSDGVTTELQTNGCFNDKVRDWILDNINIIWVSFDGEPDIQNKNRPCANGKPSSPIIEKNVKWLIDNKGNRNINVGARVTMTNNNIKRQKEIVDYFYSLGIKHIWTDPLFPSVEKKPVCEDIDKQQSHSFDMNTYLENYLQAYHYAKNKGIFYGSFLMCNFDGKCNKHCRACTPVPHFTTDGYISACDMVTFGANPHHMDCFVYGKWNEMTQSFDIDQRKVQDLRNRSTDNMLHCTNCVAKEHCGGYCLGEVMNETGSLLGQKEDVCKAIRVLFKEIGEQNKFEFLHP